MKFEEIMATLPPEQRAELMLLLREYDEAQKIGEARKTFLGFVKYMWPDFVEGTHHRRIAKIFDDVLAGRKRRVIINMAPRHTKSEFASVFLPAYFLGHAPNKKIIQASHTSELAVGFGRKVRGLINRPDFQSLFPNVSLSQDSKAAGRWATNRGGEYYAIGVGGAIAGKGADLFIIDDPHSEQEAILADSNPEIYNKVMEWYEGGPRQRLQPGGAIIVVMTRWSLRDLTAQLIKKQSSEAAADQWEVVELPAILPSGNPIWPEYWSIDELLRTKASIPLHKWNAQYQQQPTAEEGALIKREYWQDWESPEPPKCSVVIQAWDTAMASTTRANYSACTTWGIFEEEIGKGKTVAKIILLDAIRGKWEFPQLKQKAHEHYEYWTPDICLIEEKAAGGPLIYEFRQMGIPVQGVVNARGGFRNPNDKISRVNSITDVFASKIVYANKLKQWAQDVIEECATFPAGEADDYVDTVVMALQRFRQGGWVRTDLDEDEEDTNLRRRVPEYY